MIDTHCHLNFNAYDTMRADLLAEAAEHGITRLINPGIDLESSRAGIALAEEFEGVFAAVGVHPNDTTTFQPDHINTLRTLAAHPKVVAIGEIGLDYYRDRAPKEVQQAAFEAQLVLAAELALPVIIHNREASADVLDILGKWVATLPPALQDRPGVLHSFSDPAEGVAERALEMGFYLGFTGPVTFKKAEGLRAVARRVPDDRILIETDGPFLTPHPHRGKFPNRPAYVRFVAERLAEERNTDLETFTEQTTANATRLFKLPE